MAPTRLTHRLRLFKSGQAITPSIKPSTNEEDAAASSICADTPDSTPTLFLNEQKREELHVATLRISSVLDALGDYASLVSFYRDDRGEMDGVAALTTDAAKQLGKMSEGLETFDGEGRTLTADQANAMYETAFNVQMKIALLADYASHSHYNQKCQAEMDGVWSISLVTLKLLEELTGGLEKNNMCEPGSVPQRTKSAQNESRMRA